MKFCIEQDGETLIASFSGSVLFEDTPEFSSQLEGLLGKEFREIILNFTGITGITSGAIGAVIDFHQKLAGSGRQMRIRGMSEKAYSVFKHFKLDQLISIER